MIQKRGQLQLTFNWIYILIAGAVILLFFIGIVVKGKVVAEESLEEDVLRIMESILVGAGVSEKTKNFIDISGLADYNLVFECSDGYAGFGIKDGQFQEVVLEPMFAPQEIKTTKLILWSLPYKMPYKVMDLLMVTSFNTKYFVLGGEGTPFKEELEKSVGDFNFDFSGDVGVGRNYHVRVVDLDGTGMEDGMMVQGDLGKLDDSRASGISFSGTNQVTYYQKEGGVWRRGRTVEIISMVDEKDAAKYAAIFAADAESYKCNMGKVFKRMLYVNKVYEGKLKAIVQYYEDNPLVASREECQVILVEAQENMKKALESLKGGVTNCESDYDVFCVDLMERARQVNDLNEELEDEGCVMLY